MISYISIFKRRIEKVHLLGNGADGEELGTGDVERNQIPWYCLSPISGCAGSQTTLECFSSVSQHILCFKVRVDQVF